MIARFFIIFIALLAVLALIGFLMKKRGFGGRNCSPYAPRIYSVTSSMAILEMRSESVRI